jgi:hypothetical protein
MVMNARLHPRGDREQFGKRVLVELEGSAAANRPARVRDVNPHGQPGQRPPLDEA